MREIMFRGKRLDNGEWTYGYLFQIWEQTYILWGTTNSIPNMIEVDPETVGQMTGLKDKNGKEIYEGDIVKQLYHAVAGSYDDQETFSGHHIGEVVITARKGVCMRNPLCYSEETDETARSNQYKNVTKYRCEVIGNIYENLIW